MMPDSCTIIPLLHPRQAPYRSNMPHTMSKEVIIITGLFLFSRTDRSENWTHTSANLHSTN